MGDQNVGEPEIIARPIPEGAPLAAPGNNPTSIEEASRRSWSYIAVDNSRVPQAATLRNSNHQVPRSITDTNHQSPITNHLLTLAAWREICLCPCRLWREIMKTTAVVTVPEIEKTSRRNRRSKVPHYLYVLPAVSLFVVFVIYPILWVISESLYGRGASHPTGFVGIDHYRQAFNDPVFWRVLLNMSLWGAITIPVQMVVGGTIAYLIERYTSRSKTFFRVMFFLPVITSVAVVSIVWSQMYAPYYGIIQEYAKYIGLQLNVSPLGEPNLAIYALIVVNIWQWTGFSMIMYVAGLNSIPNDLWDAAKIDGAHGWQLAVRVVVPLLSPVSRSLLLLGVIGTLQTFPIVHLMTDGGPDHASEIFGTYIFKQGFVIGDTGYASALSTLVLIIALVLSIIQIAVLGARLGPSRKPTL
jgi:raffinose/stachyose/melibiose transport system permease protein